MMTKPLNRNVQNFFITSVVVLVAATVVMEHVCVPPFACGVATTAPTESEGPKTVRIKKTTIKSIKNKDGKVIETQPVVSYKTVELKPGETRPKKRTITKVTKRKKHTPTLTEEERVTTSAKKRKTSIGLHAPLTPSAPPAPAIARMAASVPPTSLEPEVPMSAPPTSRKAESVDDDDEDDEEEQEQKEVAPPPPPPPPPPVVQQRIIPKSESFMVFSDPHNYGLRYCWKFVMPLRSPYNWGYLVDYNECTIHPRSQFYQETTDVDVCIDTGGVEVVNMPFDGSSLPYKVSCIPHAAALASQSDTCWSVKSRFPFLTLDKLANDENNKNVCFVGQPWAFHDGRHVSSRFDRSAGGVDSLFHCNGGLYKEASVLYRMKPDGQITGFGPVTCQPSGPTPNRQCQAPCYKCIQYHLKTEA